VASNSRTGAEALAFLARIGQPGGTPRPDVLLLDLNLPKIDGPAILREFRKHPQCATTPVIVVTSSDTVNDRARMAEIGVDRYFKKPSDLDAFPQLGAIVREVTHTR
jgi:DNA-binding response OmpR family regulator